MDKFSSSAMCQYGISNDLYDHPTTFQIIFHVVYDIESILYSTYQNKEEKMLSYVTTISYIHIYMFMIYVTYLYAPIGILHQINGFSFYKVFFDICS